MNIVKDFFYKNRTRKYLLPVFFDYGNEFITKLNALYKSAVGIGDYVLDTLDISYNRHIFVLVDLDVNRKFSCRNILWFIQNCYIENCYYYGDIHKTNLYMMVFKIPEKKPRLIQDFILGRYSNMYTQIEIKDWFSIKYSNKIMEAEKERTVNILTKDENYKKIFLQIINNKFDMQLDKTYFENRKIEYDFKPVLQREIFNYALKN